MYIVAVMYLHCLNEVLCLLLDRKIQVRVAQRDIQGSAATQRHTYNHMHTLHPPSLVMKCDCVKTVILQAVITVTKTRPSYMTSNINEIILFF